MLGGAALPTQTVIKGFPVTAGLFKMEMVLYFLRNSGWVLAKFTANAFKRCFFNQPLFNDISLFLEQMSVLIHMYLLKRHHPRHHNFM